MIPAFKHGLGRIQLIGKSNLPPHYGRKGSDAAFPHSKDFPDISKVNLFSQNSLVQPKSIIHSPGDNYEKEADRMASQVVQTPEPSIQKYNSWETKIHRKQDQAFASSFSDGFQTQLRAIPGHGHSMDPATSRDMSSRFGYNFSNVRIHRDFPAARLSQHIQARAFTRGADIYFNENEYQPKSTSGMHLLAHELTHVVQQSSQRDLNGVNHPLTHTHSPRIQRQTNDAEAATEEEGQRFRAGRRADLGRIIEGMRFRKVLHDCSRESRVHLINLLERVRRRALSNPACGRFFRQTFRFGPERVLELNRPPTMMIDPDLTVSGRTRCPSPSVRFQPAICTSRLQDRVIMHELTHYAGCLSNGRPTSEETARQGEDICIGTVSQELERHRQQAREGSERK